MGKGVGPVLRMSDDIDGIIAAAREDNPGQEIRVVDRHAYVRIEGDPPLRITRASIEKHVGRDFPLRELELMMSALTDREREILRLRFVEDLTQSEIGDRVGLSQMHISRLLRQAVAQLREAAQPSEEPAHVPKNPQRPR